MRWGEEDRATGPKTAFPRCQAERRASYNPIVRPVGSSGPSVMTLIIIGKMTMSCGFAPTAKSIGPPVERADVASLLKQTVAGRGSLDFGADRRDYEAAARSSHVRTSHARGTLRRVGRADAAEIEAAKEPRTPIAFFKNIVPPNARDFTPRRTSGPGVDVLAIPAASLLSRRIMRLDTPGAIAKSRKHTDAGQIQNWSLDLRGPERRRTGACSEGGNL